jgi:RNA polymerase sigma factor (sigma-70 family)
LNAEPSEIPGIFEKILYEEKGLYRRWLTYADLLLWSSMAGKLRIKYEAKDIIHSLFDKLCTGCRKWDIEKYPCIKTYMFMLIKSEISNLTVNELKYVEVEKTTEEIAENTDQKGNLIMEDIYSVSLADILSGADAQELFDLSLNKLDGNDNDGIIFLLASEGSTNRDIADYLGVNVSFVENARKRIKRKLLPLFEEFLERKIQ